MGKLTRVIIDTDPGVDDALAILLALRSPELEVVAITTVCGNVPVEQATRNLFRVLSLVSPLPSLRIGQGASRPLLRPLETAIHFHGTDGLGELDRVRNEDGSPRYQQPTLPRTLPTAQSVWSECLRRYPHELTLITLGPLTNLATALAREPSPIRKLRAVISMGGALAVPGNVTPVAEFNIFADPHAAQRVAQSGLPLTLVPLDVGTQVALTRDAIRRLTAETTDPVTRFLGDATAIALAFAEETEGAALFPLHDPLAVAVAIDPTLVKLAPLHLEVDTEGSVTRGVTVADRRSPGGSGKSSLNLQAAVQVDGARALAFVQDRLCRR